jgi:NAD(P)-dependent dehydrogenase (short-subunit alcohol dehydrogenase family)
VFSCSDFLLVVGVRREMGSAVLLRRLEGKVAVITASTQGIGFAIARRLALEGAAVVISSRKQKNVDEAVAKLKAEGLDVFGLACHVSFADQRANLIKSTIDVRIWKLPILLLALLLHLVLTLAQENIQSWKDVINSSRAYYTHHISLDT